MGDEYLRDETIDEVKEEIVAFFNQKKKEIFYLRQIQIMFEKKYFHWITEKAVNELVEEGYLRKHEKPLKKGIRLIFVFHKSYRYFKKKVKIKSEVVKEFSDPIITRSVGERAEILFSNALMKRGFVVKGEHTNEARGKKWKKSKHNLDLILSKDNIIYGCEIKNTLAYINLISC